MVRLSETLAAVPELDARACQAARARLDSLTKPRGSLGRLESLAAQLAAMRAEPRPRLERRAVIVCAADHGVAQSGVSAYPQAVTLQMLRSFVRGQAAISVLARQHGAQLRVVDVGVRGAGPEPGVLARRIGDGTRNLAVEAAMSREDAVRSLEIGIELAADADLLAIGDMGIANTTAGAALISAFTGVAPRAVAGRGTGVDDAALARKIDAIETALRARPPEPKDPLGVLASLGGFEHGALAGIILGAAARRIPVLLDGLACGAAALIAHALAPRALAFCIAAHVSAEPGHRIALDHLALEPLLDLGLRLGEASGAALGFPLVESACALLDGMATFEEAGVRRG